MTSSPTMPPPGGDGLRAQIWRIAAQTQLPEHVVIQQLLDVVGPALDVSRACFYRLRQDALECTLDWHREDLSSAVGARIPWEAVSAYADRDWVELDPLGVLPSLPADVQARVRPALDEMFGRFGVRTSLAVPYAIDGQIDGVLTFQLTTDTPAGWSEPLRPVVGDLVQIINQTLARKRAEAALAASEAAFRALFELAADAIYIVAKDGRVLAANAAACRNLGYAREELQRMRVDDFARVPRHDRRLSDLELIGSAMLDGIHTRRDGTQFHVEVSFARVMFAGHGAACCIARDVTERRRAEQALRDSEQRFRELADLLPQVVYECDAAGAITYVNRRGLELLGLTAADVARGLSMLDVVPPESHEQVTANLAEAVSGADPRDGAEAPIVTREYRIRAAGGRVLDFVTFSVPILRDGRRVGLRGVGLDVTDERRAAAERHRLEAKMLQAQKLESLGLLAGGIAHDFNNLLVGILGNAELAVADLARYPQAVRRLERIKRGAQRASELANQMLAYSGKGEAVVERFDLSATVEELSGLVQSAVTQKGVLRFELARALPAVEADVTQVRQVVMNLILNAAEALADAPGAITVRTGIAEVAPEALAEAWAAEDLAPGRFVFVEVADTGCGMDEATRARIFDPFFTTKFTGRGLGLAAVLGIVRQHRGAITVDSAPGRGTVFRVLLPAAGAAVATATAPADADAWRGRGTILVVDDEPDVREVSGEMLRALGFHVRTAANGRDAITALQRHRREVVAVLLDLTMPIMSGVDAFPRLRELAPDLPIIIASGYGEGDVARRFDPAGEAVVVQKPFGLETLRAKLREALGA
ncbi:MAG TPA: PAS domain S-box protein [Polyangia bacterium]|jgi:PAS domain S-box-containing protein